VGVDGAGLRRLTRNDVDDTGPVWSPTGARIAFTRLTGGSNDVWSMRPNGTDKRRLTTSSAHEAAGAWSPEP
jgi:TolB protein